MTATGFAWRSLLVLLLAWTTLADDPNATFDSLFGNEAKTVKTSVRAADKVQFAKKLLDAAAGVSADKPLQALLYHKAYEFAAVGPEGYPLAIQAMESLVKAQPDQKSDAAKQVLLISEKQYRAATGAQRQATGKAYLSRLVELADSQLAAKQWDEAAAGYRQAAPLAAQVNPTQSAEIAAKLKGIAERRDIEQKIETLRKRLAADANDAKAAADLITLLLVEAADPEEAAKYASATSDAMLKKIVELSQKTVDALAEDEALELGKWYRAQMASATQTGKINAAGGATECYERFLSLHRTEDGARLAATMALQEVKKVGMPAVARVRKVDLLKLVDPAKDAILGKWTLKGGVLLCDPGRDATSRIEFPYTPPEEYDYRIVFVRVGGNGAINPICRAGGRQFGCQVGGWGNTVAGFEVINGRRADENPTMKRTGAWLANDQRYTLVIRVRNDGAETLLDDKVITSVKTNYADMSLHGDLALRRPDVIGLRAVSPTRVESAEVIEVSGEGKKLR
ncbi:MAG: hypothetical protein ABSH20_03035 [Tepidisphaeraceae bacterium]|jgi:hypothetical protein